MIDGLDVHLVTRENLAQVKTVIVPFPPVIETRVRRGDLALLAAQGSQWVFRSSVVLGETIHPVTGHPLHLEPHDAYLECAETMPEWRGRGVAPGMLGPTMRELLDRGYTRALMTINIANHSSCRAAEKGGARRIGMIIAYRSFGRWHATYMPLTADNQALPLSPNPSPHVAETTHRRQIAVPRG